MDVTREQQVVASSAILLDRVRKAPALCWPSLCVALGMFVSVFGTANAKAQEAEPRSYSNTPIGLNFLIAGYVYVEGKMAFDPNLAIVDAKFHSDTGGARLCSVLRYRGPVGQIRCDRADNVVLSARPRERPTDRAPDVRPRRPPISRLGQFVCSSRALGQGFCNLSTGSRRPGLGRGASCIGYTLRNSQRTFQTHGLASP